MYDEFLPVIEEIKKGKKFIVVCHINPEGDALGTLLGLAIALKDAGKEVIAYVEDTIPELYDFLPGREMLTDSLVGVSGIDASFAVDCGQIERLGKNFAAFPGKGTLINLDHHVSNSNFGDINVVWAEASAAGEVIFELLKAAGLKVSKQAAMNLYVAIHTDTGSFRYSSSTARAFKCAGELVELGAEPWEASTRVYESYPAKRFKLLGLVLQTLELIQSGRVAVLNVTGEMLDTVDGDRGLTDGFVNYARSIKGVEVGILLREDTPENFKISLRSKGRVDVSKIAASFGGGGHANASGLSVVGDLEQVKKKLFDAIEEKLELK